MEILKEIFMCLFWIVGILLALITIFAIIQTFIRRIRPKKISKSASKYISELEKEDYEVVYEYLKNKGYEFVSSEVGMVPDNYVSLSEEESEKVNVLLDILDEDEDIKNVWHNLK